MLAAKARFVVADAFDFRLDQLFDLVLCGLSAAYSQDAVSEGGHAEAFPVRLRALNR